MPGREPRLETLDLGVRDFWDIWDGGRLRPTIFGFGHGGHMIKKGLALQSSRLREDELELEVPPDLVAGRLGGAHSLQRISGRALSPRGSSGSLWEEPLLVWGCPAASRPGFSLCLAASGPLVRRAVRLASLGLVFGTLRCPALAS